MANCCGCSCLITWPTVLPWRLISLSHLPKPTQNSSLVPLFSSLLFTSKHKHKKLMSFCSCQCHHHFPVGAAPSAHQLLSCCWSSPSSFSYFRFGFTKQKLLEIFQQQTPNTTSMDLKMPKEEYPVAQILSTTRYTTTFLLSLHLMLSKIPSFFSSIIRGKNWGILVLCSHV